MRLSLLDWAACAIAGATEPVATMTRAMVLAEGGRSEATLVGQPIRVPMRAAALANGAASHALDYDDTHFGHIGHPSVAVVPAALAAAQATGAGGADFLVAALIGAETSIRVGIWLGRAHYQAGFHQTATAGAFGATMAAGRLLGLDSAQLVNAIGLVSSRASGLKAQFGRMGKPLNAGIAAANGVEAALLARGGITSDAQGLDSFGAACAGEADETAFDGLGSRWLMLGVSHKFHACCHGLHAMLGGIADIGHADPADVQAVSVTAHPRWQTVCNIKAPTTGLAAKFSFRMCAAMALAGVDTGTPESYSDQVANDPVLIRLRDRVVVRFDAAIAETATTVRVQLRDGSSLYAEHDIANAQPVSVTAEKLHKKAAALLGADRANALWQALSAGPDMPKLLAVLQG